MSVSTLRCSSIPTRYLLRNRWPTMPPSWKPRRALGARRFRTTTGKFEEKMSLNFRSTPGSSYASRSHPDVP